MLDNEAFITTPWFDNGEKDKELDAFVSDAPAKGLIQFPSESKKEGELDLRGCRNERPCDSLAGHPMESTCDCLLTGEPLDTCMHGLEICNHESLTGTEIELCKRHNCNYERKLVMAAAIAKVATASF